MTETLCTRPEGKRGRRRRKGKVRGEEQDSTHVGKQAASKQWLDFLDQTQNICLLKRPDCSAFCCLLCKIFVSQLSDKTLIRAWTTKNKTAIKGYQNILRKCALK